MSGIDAGTRLSRLSVFPLGGALLFPRAQLPLHIFEPRYRAMVSDALARDRRIGMIQPRPGPAADAAPPLFDIGCIGHIANVEALDDGRFTILLAGLTRFRVVRELEVTTPFRQVEASMEGFDDGGDPDPLPLALRAAVEQEARRYAETTGHAVDWDMVGKLDDETLVNALAQIVPFDLATKQALLEAADLSVRADLLVQLLCFARMDGEAGRKRGGRLQ